MTDEPQEQPQEQPTPSWFIDEGIPGAGDRPAWLPEKFKSAADMAKAHSELEKRLGVAPDEYDFSKSKYLDPDYVPFNDLKQLAKDKRVPQEVIDKMLESVDKYMDEFSIDEKEEFKKLGNDAENRVKTLDNWLKANAPKEDYEALTSSLRDAASIKALEGLRNKMMSDTPQVPNGNGEVAGQTTLEEMKMELATNLEKYKTDDKYRKDYTRRLEAVVKSDSNYVDKVGS